MKSFCCFVTKWPPVLYTQSTQTKPQIKIGSGHLHPGSPADRTPDTPPHLVPAHTSDPQEQLQQQQLPCLLYSRKAPDHSQQGTSAVLTIPYYRQLQLAELGAIPNHMHYAPVVSAGRTSTSVPPWSTKYTSVGSPTNCKLRLKFYLPLFHTWLCTTKHPNS